jgi:hypothetical protein
VLCPLVYDLLCLTSMASHSLPSALSASRLRRQRSAATKQKLFKNTVQGNSLQIVSSQLAYLTWRLDHIANALHLDGYQVPAVCSTGLNVSAPQFVPTDDIVSEIHAASGYCATLASDDGKSDTHSSSISEEASPVFAGAWEPLEPWLFLDAKELASVSQTCRTNSDRVSDYTPFANYSASAGVISNAALQTSEGGPDNLADSWEIIREQLDSCLDSLRGSFPSIHANVLDNERNTSGNLAATSLSLDGRLQAIKTIVSMAHDAISSSVKNQDSPRIEGLLEYYHTQVMELLQGSVEQMFGVAEVQGFLKQS